VWGPLARGGGGGERNRTALGEVGLDCLTRRGVLEIPFDDKSCG